MTFELQPTLRGSLLELRPLREEDWADLYAAASDPLRHNAEMKRLMLDHAFRFVDTVIFLVGPQNHRSRRAVEKIGGVLSGTRFERGHEAVEYRITREAWFAD